MRLSRGLESAIGVGAAIALLTACSGGIGFCAVVQGVAYGTLGGSPSSRLVRRVVGSRRRLSAGSRSCSSPIKAIRSSGFILKGAGSNPAPIGEITDAISGPDGLFVYKNGTLYVCNFDPAQ